MKKLVETNTYKEINLDFIIDFFTEKSNVYPEMRQKLIALSKKENGVPVDLFEPSFKRDGEKVRFELKSYYIKDESSIRANCSPEPSNWYDLEGNMTVIK